MARRTSFASQTNDEVAFGSEGADLHSQSFSDFRVGSQNQAREQKQREDEENARLMATTAMTSQLVFADNMRRSTEDTAQSNQQLINMLQLLGYDCPPQLRSFLTGSAEGADGRPGSSEVNLNSVFGRTGSYSAIDLSGGNGGVYDGTFNSAIKLFLKHEGGYVNNARDNGGETIMGITRKNFPGAFAQVSSLARAGDMEGAREAAAGFYKENFWDPIVRYVDQRFPDMSQTQRQALYYAGFDMACHSGIGTSKRFMANADGDAERMIQNRVSWMMGLEDADVFGKGWARRGREVMASVQNFELRGPAPALV